MGCVAGGVLFERMTVHEFNSVHWHPPPQICRILLSFMLMYLGKVLIQMPIF